MALFARNLGHHGPPFPWNPELHRRLRARLDALTRHDASYILETFPIVKRQDEAEFGHFRTKALIHASITALIVGDSKTVMAL